MKHSSGDAQPLLIAEQAQTAPTVRTVRATNRGDAVKKPFQLWTTTHVIVRRRG